MGGDAFRLDDQEIAARHAEHETLDRIVGLAPEQLADGIDAGGELCELGTHVAPFEHPLHAGDQLTDQRLTPRRPCGGARRCGVRFREQSERGEPLG